MTIGTGFYTSHYYNTTYSTLTEPTTMTSYKSNLNKYKTFETNDFTNVASAHQYTTVLTNLNSKVSCKNDKWVLYTGNCPSGYTTWTAANGATGGNTSSTNMCIAVQTFKQAGFSASNRYTSGVCSGATVTEVNTMLTNLNNFFNSANTLYDNMIGNSGSNGLDQAGTGANTYAKSVFSGYANTNTRKDFYQ